MHSNQSKDKDNPTTLLAGDTETNHIKSLLSGALAQEGT